MAPTFEDRLSELEVRLAFMDEGLTALNSSIANHDRLLHDLRGELKYLRDELGVVRNGLAHDPSSEPPPPHY